MPVILNTFPAELLFHVANNIEKQQDLIQLASCSRRTYDIVVPLAYRSIYISRGSVRQASGVLRAILLNPNLSQWVREIHVKFLEYSYLANQAIDPKEKEPFPLDKQLLRDAVEKASHSEVEVTNWMVKLLAGDLDAYVALLLVPLSGLKRLHFNCLDSGLMHTCTVLERAGWGLKPFDSRTSAFPQLTEARFYDTEGKYYDHIRWSRGFASNRFVPFLRFSNMESIEATRVSDDDPPWVVHGKSNIQHLRLTGRICVNGLHDLLPNCRSLKTFKYEHCSPCDLPSFDPRPLYESLLATKHSLMYLSLTNYIEDSYCSDNTFLGSFSMFTSLKQLQLAISFLRDPSDESLLIHTLLPHSLEYFVLADTDLSCAEWLIDQFDSWTPCWKKATPNLTVVHILSWPVDEEGELEEKLKHGIDRWTKEVGEGVNIWGNDVRWEEYSGNALIY